MKILYIIALVLTVVFGVVVVHYANEYDRVRWDNLFNDFYSYDYYSYDSSRYELHGITSEGSTISLLFLAFYIFVYSFTLKNIKRLTAKVMSIIGLCIGGLAFLITLLPIGDPGAISFNEFAPFLIFIQLIMLAFCIVNLVQAVRNDSALAATKSNQTIVDDVV